MMGYSTFTLSASVVYFTCFGVAVLIALLVRSFRIQQNLKLKIEELTRSNVDLQDEKEKYEEEKQLLDEFESEEFSEERDLAKLSMLTGLFNRSYFMESLNEIVNKAQQTQERLALFFIDLDNFKDINDDVGPTVGDLLLQRVAQRLQELCRETHHMVGHLGGDEFAILMENCEEGSKPLADFATKIIKELSEVSYELEEKLFTISASIGIATFPDASDDAEGLVKHTDIAIHNAKKLGKSIHSFFTKEMSSGAKERSQLVGDLRKAVEEKQLVLFYQPKVSFETGLIYGSEALIRWKHPEKGMISPGVFIPIAEDSGLINPIGDWIIETACKDTMILHKEGYRNLQVAINLSSNQFNKGDVAGVIAEMIWETGIDPSTVELELTESVVMGNAEKSILMLRVLKSMGVQLAVDDFGTGYSSLNQLKHFPINTLKIDQSFVKNMHLDVENAAIVSTIIAMGKRLGLKLVAEGVECKEEYDMLKNEGVDLMQGYYFSKPLPFSDFAALVRKHCSKN